MLPREIHTPIRRTSSQHKNDGACGEIMASYTYLLNNQLKGLKGKKDPQPKTIAWFHSGNDDKAYNPCGSDSEMEWGCNAFCSKMGFSVVDVSTHEANGYSKVTHTAQKTIMNDALKKEFNDAIEDKKKELKENQKAKEQKQIHLLLFLIPAHVDEMLLYYVDLRRGN